MLPLVRYPLENLVNGGPIYLSKLLRFVHAKLKSKHDKRKQMQNN